MAFLNLSKLAESVESTFTAAKKLFGMDTGGNGNDYPTLVKDNTDLAKFQPSKYLDGYDFSFSVVDKDNSTVNDFIEFPIPIAPSNISTKEPFPTRIRATQGGTAVYRNGLKYREIGIKGTTGIYPSRSAMGIGKDGVSRGAPNTAGTEGVKKASGYEAFMRFRNWFRAFHLVVDEKDTAKDYRIIFNNYKDGEFLVVEILDFTTIVDSARPLMMDYDIKLKVLGSKPKQDKEALSGLDKTFSDIDAAYATIIDKIDGARAVFLGSQDILRQVDSNIDAVLLEPLRKISMAVKSASNTAGALGDIGPSISKKFMTSSLLVSLMESFKSKEDDAKVTGGGSGAKIPNNIGAAVSNQGPDILKTLPPTDLLGTDLGDMPDNILTAHEDEREAARRLPRRFFEDAIAEINRIGDNAADKFGVGSTDYDELEGRTATDVADEAKTPTDREFGILAAFEEVQRAFNDLITSKEFFKDSYANKIKRMNEAFDGALGLEAKEGVRDYILPTNITLEEVALYELGDSVRWVEIIELNNLVDPFIVQDRSQKTDGVVAPGDKILIPTGGTDFGDIPIFRDSPLLDDLTHLEKSMGIDLKMTKNMDIELSNTGDFVLSRGLDNASQAITLKLLYAKKELFEHPDIGVGLKIGSKGQDPGAVRAAILDSLTSDPRFESLTELTVIREGNTLKITFSVKLKNVDIPLPLELRV